MITREIPPVGGGAGFVALSLAREYAKRGHQVRVLTMHFGQMPLRESLEVEGARWPVEIERLRCFRRRQDSSYAFEMLLFTLRGIARLFWQRGRRSFDLVHAHAIIPDGVLALAAGHFHSARVLVTSHGSDVPGYNPDDFVLLHTLLAPIWRAIARRFDRLVSPSSHLAQLIRRTDSALRVEVLPNGVADDFGPIGDKTGEMLIVSRLVRRKNYHLFFEALEHVKTRCTVHVVGEGPELPALKAQAAQLSEHDIRFHGWLENGSDAWRDLYRRASFFVFPSSSENFPINLLEAQCAGLVVLASPIPANREVVGECAIFFDDTSREAILTSIDAALAMGEIELRSCAEAARRRVLEEFTWTAIGERYDRVINELCGSGK